MADNKQPFDDEFNTDEFEAFDDDDFDFDADDDDDEETSFQLNESNEAESEEDESSSPYAFSDEEALSDEPEEEAKFGSQNSLVQNVFDRLKNEEPKQLIKYALGAGIGLLFLVGTLYKFIMPNSAETKAKTSASSPLVNQSNTLSGSSNIIPVSSGPQINTAQPPSSSKTPISLGNMTPASAIPNPSSSSIAPVANSSNQGVSTTLPPSQQETDETSQHTKQLEAQVNQLTQQVSADAQMNAASQAQIAGLIKSVDNMQSQVAKLTIAMQTIVSAASQSNNRQSGFISGAISGNAGGGRIAQRVSEYYVQAIIPGRAWLKNSNGQIITVAPGDAIPGYGTVAAIDAQNGVVIMSTGSKIVFGIDEG
ncbi:MAG: hypothetical protein K2Q14_04005 [Gammaproteobacteria bacterium]|nr:hypothetical protein [Gammaproteobacteria bacterium]